MVDSSGNETTVLESQGYPIPPVEVATTSANLMAYGVSQIPYSSAANLFTLDPPKTGVRKTLVLTSTKVADSTTIAMSIYTGSTAIGIKDNSTTYNPKLYVNMIPPYACVELIGLSTSEWGVIGTHGGAQISTAVTYSS